MFRLTTSLALFVLCTAVSGAASNDKLFLHCSTSAPSAGEQTDIVVDIQLFEESKGMATLVRGDTKETGVALATQYFYHLTFAESGSSPQSVMSINRYTGYFKLETGKAPFGEVDTQNRLDTGSCEAAHRKF